MAINFYTWANNGSVGGQAHVGITLNGDGVNQTLKLWADGRLTTSKGNALFANDLDTVTWSGNPGDDRSWTCIRTSYPASPSGYRYRMMGQVNFTAGDDEHSIWIDFPHTLMQLLPGAYGASTVFQTNIREGNDSAAQILDINTEGIRLSMNLIGGGSWNFPVTATWYVEGF